jgi:hypothetical protein
MWQCSTLGNYHLSIKLPVPPNKVLTVEETIAFQQLVFCHLKGILGGDQVVLVEPEGELGTPQRRVLAVKIALDEALCLKNHTDFIVIHRLTQTQGYCLGYRGVWADTYMRTAMIPKHELFDF